MKFILLGGLGIIALITAGCYFFPKINFRPMPEGLCAGQLPADKPNWVSSLVDEDNSHHIAPFKNLSLGSMANLLTRRFPEYTIVDENHEHLIAYKQTRILHFTDWLCIRADGNVSSSATMGYSDFGKNRSDVESIRYAHQKNTV